MPLRFWVVALSCLRVGVGEVTPEVAAQQVRFALTRLAARNAHHLFEEVCRHFALARISRSILPATGPVGQGGDQGRDFETFRTYLNGRLPGSFLAAESDRPVVFACTLQSGALPRKIRQDVTAIAAGVPTGAVYVFCEADLPVGRRHQLIAWAQREHGICLEVIDGTALAEQLVQEDLFWIAERFLAVPASMQPRSSCSQGQTGAEVPQQCPYRGLLPYEEDDAAFFYGREDRVADLVSMLAGRAAGAGVVVVTGPSGAGKSSLLRAGLLAAISRGDLHADGSSGWPRSVITPTGSPLDELAACLASVPNGPGAAGLRRELAAHPEEAHLALRQAQLTARESAGAGWRLVLVVDQFEHLFTLCEQERERHAYITALHALAANPVGPEGVPPALVVAGVRGDYLDQCAAYPQLATAIEEGVFLLGPMGQAELTRVIAGPAATAGLELEAGLVDTILSDLRSPGAPGRDGYDAGTLPLLSHAMLATWNLREANRLTIRGYGHTGGVRRAVHDSAERAYASLTAGQQQAARAMLSQLTAIAVTGQVTRRQTPLAELRTAYPGGDTAEVTAVLDRFARDRLLVVDATTAQIAHDALPAAWDRLRQWLEEDRALLIPYQRLADDAREWAAGGHDRGLLYRGTRLAAAQEALAQWKSRPGRFPAATTAQVLFLDASAGAQRRGTRVRRLAAAALAVITALAVIAAVFAMSQTATANHERDIAVAGQATADSETIGDTNPSLSQLLSVAAWRVDPTPATRFGMIAALVRPAIATLTGLDGPVHDVAFSPDGRTLAAMTGSGTVRLWDMPAHHPIPASFLRHETGLQPVLGSEPMTFSPKGNLVISPDGRTIRWWDTTTGRQAARPLAVPDSGLADGPEMAVSPATGMLATTGGDGMVHLWDATSHRQIGGAFGSHDTDAEIDSLAFSPDGRELAAVGSQGSDQVGAIWLWDSVTHREIGGATIGADSPGTRTASIRLTVAFSPDGRIVAAGGIGGTVWLCDSASGRRIGVLRTTGTINGIAFSPDGLTLATAGDDGTVRLWDTASWTEIDTPVSTGLSAANSIAFSPDGRILAVGGNDSTVRLLDVATDHQTGVITAGHPGPPGTLAVTFSPDRRTVATAGTSGTRLRDITTGRQVGATFTISHPSSPAAPGLHITALAFGPGPHTLTAADYNGIVQWDTLTHQVINSIPKPMLFALALDRNGRTAVSAFGSVHTWDTASGRLISTWNLQAGTLALSPDGHFLAAAIDNKTIELWDAITRRRFRVIADTTDSTFITSMAFSPDDATLAAISQEGTVRLWDTATGNQIGPLIGVRIKATDFRPAVAFSTDGRTLATAGQDGIVRLWDVSELSDPASQLCARADSELTPQEWSTYLPGVHYRQICP